jgi:hypothetical protein
MVKVRKRRLLHGPGQAMGRDRVSTQPIFSHLQGTEALTLNRQRIRAEDKRYAYLKVLVTGVF